MSEEIDEFKAAMNAVLPIVDTMTSVTAKHLLVLVHQKNAGDLLVAVTPSLANQIDHTLSPTDFAKELAKTIVEFDKERMRLANEAQASPQIG